MQAEVKEVTSHVYRWKKNEHQVLSRAVVIEVNNSRSQAKQATLT